MFWLSLIGKKCYLSYLIRVKGNGMRPFFVSFLILCCLSLSVFLYAQDENRKNLIMDGNRITTEVWNYGSFSAPGNRISDFIWKGLGYAYEIGFFIGAEVEIADSSHPDAYFENGKWYVHIISDGMKTSGGEISPDGKTRWGWQPVQYNDSGYLEYLNPISNRIAYSTDIDLDMDGKPDSWPDSWWNSQQNDCLWPGLWASNQVLSDEEFIYGMDDHENLEFEYFPFVSDSNRGGLGVSVEVRGFQIQDFYEDILFVTFDLHNISDKDIDKMLFGVWGDPHIGGPDDWNDDWQAVDKGHQLIYAWDDNGSAIGSPIVPGYFGLAFLQTAGNATDGMDNDNDGMIDESPYDGIDNDNDWLASRDDLGADGVAASGDEGEGDGIPTPGEPNFEWKDMDEYDMLGITSFRSPSFSEIRISEDEKVWQIHTPQQYDSLQTPGDYIFTAASGYFSLKKGRRIRLGTAFLFGQNYSEMIAKLNLANEYYTFHLGNQALQSPFYLSSPDSNSRHENTVTLVWEPSQIPEGSQIEWAYKIEGQSDWKAGDRNLPNNGQYEWDVSGLPNSAFYKVRMRWYNPASYAIAESRGNFVIDHSGQANVAPEVLLDLPDSLIITDDFTISWRSADADGDDLQQWLILYSDIVNDTIEVNGQAYRLKSPVYPNGFYQIKIVVSDGKAQTSSPVRTIQIWNSFPFVEEEYISHIQGYSTAAVMAEIVDRTELKDRIYIVEFIDSLSAFEYSVRDSSSGGYIIKNETLPEYPASGTLFDGLRLSFNNPAFAWDEERSAWSSSSQTNLKINVLRRESYPLDPFDYAIRFYDNIVDTSVTNQLLPFKVIDMQTNTKMSVATPISGGTWVPSNSFFILRGGLSYSDVVWEIETFWPDSGAHIEPSDGDTYQLFTHKPLSEKDRYSINIKAMALPRTRAVTPTIPVLYGNYPNPFNGETVIRYWLPRTIPVNVTIYNILGQKVATLISEKQAAGFHTLHWNTALYSKISSGMYLCRLQAGTHTLVGKIILLK